MCSLDHMAFLNVDLDPGVVHLKSFAKCVSPTHFIVGEHSLTCCRFGSTGNYKELALTI